ncbi:hypothetical protein C8J56DRAFT_971000 [Mycena floridula]|nr:hypothetical protein C8J56DRAFT_971000 [Mycena floridula]
MSSNGWWFHPVWTIQPSWAFQLVIEGNPGEWSYLGRYVTSLLEGCEMKLSEWISLDEETKALYCNRIATERALGEPPSMLDLVETRRRFDIGEWKIPCYLLHCTGFSKELYDALHAAAKSLVSNDTTSSGPSSSSSRSTPLQRSQSLSTEYRSKKRGRGDGADAPVQPAQRPRLTETNFTEVVKRNQKTDAV